VVKNLRDFTASIGKALMSLQGPEELDKQINNAASTARQCAAVSQHAKYSYLQWRTMGPLSNSASVACLYLVGDVPQGLIDRMLSVEDLAAAWKYIYAPRQMRNVRETFLGRISKQHVASPRMQRRGPPRSAEIMLCPCV
jgi:hypothetical protein